MKETVQLRGYWQDRFYQRVFISGGTLISKCGKVRQAVTTTDAAMKKLVAGQLLW